MTDQTPSTEDVRRINYPEKRRRHVPVTDRFWSKVVKTERCWLWQGHLTDGYGQFTIDRRSYRAHRWSYEHAKGSIPEGLVIDHLCRVRNCVNPDHLEAVGNRENVLRGIGVSARAAEATHCPSGHPYSDANTRISREGHRICRECHRQREEIRRLTGQSKRACAQCGVTTAQLARHIRRNHPHDAVTITVGDLLRETANRIEAGDE